MKRSAETSHTYGSRRKHVVDALHNRFRRITPQRNLQQLQQSGDRLGLSPERLEFRRPREENGLPFQGQYSLPQLARSSDCVIRCHD